MARARSAQRPGTSLIPGFVSYYRVSTDKQGRSGLGLDAQREAVARYISGVAGELVAEFEEVESGKRRDRPQLVLALAAVRARGATLIIAKLDRLARDAEFLLSINRAAGVDGIVFCDLPQFPGPAGRLMVTMVAAFAEFEAGLISQRTKAALDAVRAKGTWVSKSGRTCTRLGGSNLSSGFDTATSRAGRDARTVLSKARAADVLPFIAAARKAGAGSLSQIAAALIARGVRAPSGGSNWSTGQVWRIERAGRAASLLAHHA
jgi:DNA invertase Pin-like site-specific DNA recombinase